MAASNASASLGEDAETRTSASRKSVEPNSEEEVHNDNEKLDLEKVDEAPVAPDDSLLATPKTSPSKRISQGKADGGSEETESAMNYSSSPTSDPEKSAPSSPQTLLNQPVVSHVPASVQQPVFQSENSSLASSATTIIPQQLHVDVDCTFVQQQPQQQHPQQTVIEENPSAVPTLVIHGTQGQVVTKRKGRFRLLRDSNTAATNLGGDVHATLPQSTENISVNSAIEAAVSGAHPARERNLSNTSTISAMSVPAAAPPAPVVPNTLNTVDSPSHSHAAPVGRKKGRFVVIPGDVTDPSLLRQPYSLNQGVLRQQPLQPVVAAVTEQVVLNTPQAATMVVPQAAVVVTQQPILSQDVTQQQVVQGVESLQQQQVPQQVPQHHVQQVPQYYVPSSHATFGNAPQAMQLSYAQQHQVGPPVAGAAASAQMQTRNSHSPVPPSAQQSHQQVMQPPAQIVLTEQPMPQPTYVVQTDDGRFHQMVPTQQQQQVVSIPEHQHAVSGLPHQQQTAGLTHEPQQQMQNVSVPVPPTAETLKPPQVGKPAAAAKRQGMQRGTSGSKGSPVNVGFGKVFYFLDQMKLEVTEADRTIKNQGRDMKFLREKNKELEARSRDMERKWLEEKAAREALETKVKSLKKKVKELKGHHGANEGESKKTKDTHQNAIESTSSQSRSNSIDDAEHTGEKGVPIATTTDVTKPSSTEVESFPASSKSNEVEGGTEENSCKQPSFSSVDVSTTEPKKRAPSKTAVPAAPAISTSSSDTKALSKVKVRTISEGSKSTQKGLEVSKSDYGGSEAVPGAPNDKLSPLRQRGSQEPTANKMAFGKSQSANSLTASMIDGTTGEAKSKPLVSSSVDSLGSASDFDPLRVSLPSNGDGVTSTPPEPISGGQQPSLSTGSSVFSFVTAPAPMQTVTFDPLSSSFQTGSTTVPAGMPPSPQHNHSQSMPNFIVQPNSMMMAYPLQQVHSSSFSLLPNGGWQQQQPLSSQNQYLPTQYADMTVPSLQPQQQYLHSQVSAVQQQQQQQQPPTAKAPGADPFDELASRRAPGTTN